MLGVKIFVRVRTFRRMPFAPSRIFCHPVIRINKINSLLSARVNVFSPENLNNRIHLRLLSVFSTHGFFADLTIMNNISSEPCYDELLLRKSNLKSSCQHGGRKWTSSPATQVKRNNIFLLLVKSTTVLEIVILLKIIPWCLSTGGMAVEVWQHQAWSATPFSSAIWGYSLQILKWNNEEKLFSSESESIRFRLWCTHCNALIASYFKILIIISICQKDWVWWQSHRRDQDLALREILNDRWILIHYTMP